MNAYLLDTHVLLWWLSNPKQLSAPAQKTIRDPNNTLLVSAAAVWEMAIKRTLGRLEYPDNLLEVLDQERIGVLAIEARHAFAVAELPLLHQDPFDRMQVAQARIEGLTVMTRDQKIRQYGVPVLAV